MPEKSKPVKEAITHPAHYNKGKYEAIDVVHDWGMNFNLGNVIKYLARSKHSGNQKQDLEKALFYLSYEIGKLP